MISNGKPRAIIAVDLDYFYAQCEEVRNPEIQGKPVVICVYSGRREDSGAVSTANYIARNLGIKSGMPIAFAKRILKGTSDAVFLPVDLGYYQAVSERVMEIIKVGSEKFEQTSIDEAFMDVSSQCHTGFDGAIEIARSVKNEIFSLEKLTSSVGIAQNKLMGKMAVDSNKPNGFTVIKPGEEALFLSRLPVGKLFGVGPKTESKLKAIQVRTIGELSLTNEHKLTEIFGKNLGRTLNRWANGIDDSPVKERPMEQLSRIVTLKTDSASFDFQEVIRSLSYDLESKLRSSKLMCRSVGIIAITTSLKAKSRSKNLQSPTQSGGLIFAISADLFAQFFQENAASGEQQRLRRAGVKISDFMSETDPEPRTLEQFF